MAINLIGIATAQERAMLKAFNEAISEIKNTTKITQLERLIEAQDFDGVIRLLGLDPSAFEGMDDALYQSYRTGGTTGAIQIGQIPTTIGDVAFRFSVRAPAAEQWIRTNSSRLVTEMTTGQVEMVRDVLAVGLEEGVNPRQQALGLIGRTGVDQKRTGGVIGLTSQQAKWVGSARNELNNLDSHYFARDLRDKRFDSVVRKAIADDKPLTKTQINKMITQMQNKTLKYRGDVIARTESINALRSGQNESVRQAIVKGEADNDDVTKEWDATLDKRTRLDHLIMEDQRVPFDQPFIFPDQSRAMFAGDTSLGAPAKQIIQCRCKTNTVIDFLGQLKRVEGFS